MDRDQLSPREVGRRRAAQTPPVTAEQARAAARIFATVKPAAVSAPQRDDAA